MTPRQCIAVTAVWIIILPFLGFPSSWKTVLMILTGLGLFWVAYSIKVHTPPTNLSL